MPPSLRSLLVGVALSLSSATFAQSSEALGAGDVNVEATGTARVLQTFTTTVPVRFGV